MTYAVSVDQTSNQDVNGVLSGLRWDTPNLTYSFPTSASLYGSSYGWGEPQNNFETLSESQRAVARQILGTISSVANLGFTEIGETVDSHATLRLAMSDTPSPAWTYIPGSTQEGGDTWFGNSSGWFDQPVRGNYAYYAFIHEMLHGLGLKHGNETSGFGAMTDAHDSMEYSVMTYRSYVGADGRYVENEPWGYAQSLMMDDIAALQHMYGANYSSNSGNTVYSWDPATGQAFVNGLGQAVPGGNRIFMTVWDGSGDDTYDFSNYASDLSVDLRPGEWSRTSADQVAQLGTGHFARGTIANALLYQGDARSLIENATGGSGNDQITGNAGANVLRGGAGSDVLAGLEGNDILIGGGGSDILTGGAGMDIIIFNTTPNRSFNLDQVRDFSVVDDRIELENAVFTNVGGAGGLLSSAFWSGTKAHDTSDRIIYDGAKGALYYDPDGSRATAQVQIAQLSKGLKMAAADFIVI